MNVSYLEVRFLHIVIKMKSYGIRVFYIQHGWCALKKQGYSEAHMYAHAGVVPSVKGWSGRSCEWWGTELTSECRTFCLVQGLLTDLNLKLRGTQGKQNSQVHKVLGFYQPEPRTCPYQKSRQLGPLKTSIATKCDGNFLKSLPWTVISN